MLHSDRTSSFIERQDSIHVLQNTWVAVVIVNLGVGIEARRTFLGPSV